MAGPTLATPVAGADPKVHIDDSNHGTGSVFLASKRVRGRVSARATSLGRRLSVDAQTNRLGLFNHLAMSLFGNWTSANSNQQQQQQQQQPNAFGQPPAFGQQAQPATGTFNSILHAKNRADFDISTFPHWLVITRVRWI